MVTHAWRVLILVCHLRLLFVLAEHDAGKYMIPFDLA